MNAPPVPTARTHLPASTSVSTALATLPASAEGAVALPQLIQEEYPWFNHGNRQQALQLLQGATIACQHGLTTQLQLYKGELVKVVTKDQADRTAALVSRQMRYKGFCYYHPPAERYLPQTFSVPIEQRGYGAQQQWIYQRLHDFAKLIPPRALQALTVLDEAGIVPDGYWVADKVEIQPRYSLPPRSLDPVLCAQFGCWFVGLAEWV